MTDFPSETLVEQQTSPWGGGGCGIGWGGGCCVGIRKRTHILTHTHTDTHYGETCEELTGASPTWQTDIGTGEPPVLGGGVPPVQPWKVSRTARTSSLLSRRNGGQSSA